MHKYSLASVALAMLASAANASHSSSVDDKGCWDARTVNGGKCLYQDGNEWRDDTLYVTYANRCQDRIYARACHQRDNGSGADCGTFGIRGGGDHVWYTYNANGKVQYRAVGSDFPSQDWVCADRGNLRG